MPTQSNSIFGNSTFTHNTNSSPSQGPPERNKEKLFRSWHEKQGIPAPQDYSLFAAQSAPFSIVRQNPNQPSALSPYLNQMLTHQSMHNMNSGLSSQNHFDADFSESRRKLTPPVTEWPKASFGTRPASRKRTRASNTEPAATDIIALEDNTPPLISFYDEYAVDVVPKESKLPNDAPKDPTQVRITNYSEDRFPELIVALRKYFGPVLEAYSGLPESESIFPDPEIFPREFLDEEVTKMVQPCSGSEGGPGPWVRLTFCDKETAEQAVEASRRGELVVGGRAVRITLWEKDPIVPDIALPFSMVTEVDPPGVKRTAAGRSSSLGFRSNSIFEDPSPPTVGVSSATDVGGAYQSEFMPGAKVIVPRPIRFANKEGWLAGWVNSLLGAGTKTGGGEYATVQPTESQGWFYSLGRIYRYLMDEVIGFKYL